METKSKNITIKGILIVMTIGIWMIVLQNAGLLPTEVSTQDVRVVNRVNSNVSGSVSVDNTIDVNLRSINGHSTFYNHPRLHPDRYFRIPVYTGN